MGNGLDVWIHGLHGALNGKSTDHNLWSESGVGVMALRQRLKKPETLVDLKYRVANGKIILNSTLD
jgi:hypothetical protein